MSIQKKICRTQNMLMLDKDEIAKRIRCHQEEETAGNTTYKKVQNPHRTRKILSFKASPLLTME